MRRILALTILLGALALALPAAAQPLDLTMTLDLYCGDPATSGTLGTGSNLATTGWLCGGTVQTPGTANAYGINLTSPMQVTVTVIGNPLQVTMLQPPYTADSCVTSSALTANPTLSACLSPGYYPILLTSPVNVLIGYEISVACAPCDPVGTEGSAWGGLKSLFR